MSGPQSCCCGTSSRCGPRGQVHRFYSWLIIDLIRYPVIWGPSRPYRQGLTTKRLGLHAR